MSSAPIQLTLELTPKARFDVIDVTQHIREELGDFLSRYGKTLYCSHHTTAGFLEQSLCARLDYSRERLGSFLGIFQHLFPPNANYQHDKMDLRDELTDEQKRVEPKNADSHLAFIGAGLHNCVTYRNRPDTAVHLIDLDGVWEHGVRTRRTTALAFNEEQPVALETFAVPISGHHIDSVNLREDRVGLFAWMQELIEHYEISKGRIEISLDPAEHHTGLTVNEYETLLMRHDLIEVLRDPVRFMANGGRDLLKDPRSIPHVTLNYARYDLVRVINQLIEVTGMSESILERAVAKFLAAPAQRFLRIKRSVNLLISDHDRDEAGQIVQGTYQSPVLVQWKKAAGQSHRLQVQLHRFA
jgi:thiamine phosphate synthase YjbQ (UPF0047 family)